MSASLPQSVQEACIRLILPFEADSKALSGLGTTAVESGLTASGLWHRPANARSDSSVKELDDLTKSAFFDVKHNGFVHLALSSPPPPLSWMPTGQPATIAAPLRPDSVELFLNPQGSGALSILLHLSSPGSSIQLADFRKFIYQLGQVHIAEDTDAELVPIGWGRKIRDAVIEWTSHWPASVSIKWLRRYLFTGIRLDGSLGPFCRDASRPEDEDLICLMWALATGLRPDQTVLPMSGIHIRALNPFHMAGVFESGAAHVVLDSPSTAKHNPLRISWVAGTYSLLTIHEILYRNAAVNLTREARTVAEMPALNAPPESSAGHGHNDSLPNDLRGAAVADLSRRLIEFQLYADVDRAGAFHAIRAYYRMASKTLGGHAALVRLRNAVTALEQVEVTEKTAANAAETVNLSRKLVGLQEKVELLEVFIFGYYLVAITHYLFHAFHIQDVYTGAAYIIMLIVGAVSCFLDPGLFHQVFGKSIRETWKRLAFRMLLLPLLVFVALFVLGWIKFPTPPPPPPPFMDLYL